MARKRFFVFHDNSLEARIARQRKRKQQRNESIPDMSASESQCGREAFFKPTPEREACRACGNYHLKIETIELHGCTSAKQASTIGRALREMHENKAQKMA